MGVVLLIGAVSLALVLWTVAVGRIVERRAIRRTEALQVALDDLRECHVGLAMAFVDRWNGLDRAVNEGLSIAAREAAAPKPDAASFVRNSVALLSQADAVVLELSEGRGYALPMKVGRC